ncbi:MAG: hypothetical protein IKT99_01400 [Oscillospiraceae bacterium]|nr:hypothetical protein [Oscillospiraceae bacterium]
MKAKQTPQRPGIVTLRRCTMKSVIGFGKYPTSTIEQVLAADASSWIRQLYYTVETIDFTDEVKEAARIRVTIPKPGTSEDAWIENRAIVTAELRAAMTEEERIRFIMHKRKMERIKTRAFRKADFFGSRLSKGQLQAVNHGRAYLKETNH